MFTWSTFYAVLYRIPKVYLWNIKPLVLFSTHIGNIFLVEMSFSINPPTRDTVEQMVFSVIAYVWFLRTRVEVLNIK